MQLNPTSIPDVMIIEPKIFADQRGFFLESYQKKCFIGQNRSRFRARQSLQIPIRDFERTTLSNPTSTGNAYPCHFGGNIRRRCGYKKILIHLRKMGKRVSISGKQEMVWVPAGLAHGFYVISPEAGAICKATDYYAPQWECTIAWDDPTIHIDCPTKGNAPILSSKGRLGGLLNQAGVFE